MTTKEALQRARDQVWSNYKIGDKENMEFWGIVAKTLFEKQSQETAEKAEEYFLIPKKEGAWIVNGVDMKVAYRKQLPIAVFKDRGTWCPSCECEVDIDNDLYCPACGQRLDWGGEE